MKKLIAILLLSILLLAGLPAAVGEPANSTGIPHNEPAAEQTKKQVEDENMPLVNEANTDFSIY